MESAEGTSDYDWLDSFGNYSEARAMWKSLRENALGIDQFYAKDQEFNDVNAAKLDALRYLVATRVCYEAKHGSENDYVTEMQNAEMLAVIGDWEKLSGILRKESEKFRKSSENKNTLYGSGIAKLSKIILEQNLTKSL